MSAPTTPDVVHFRDSLGNECFRCERLAATLSPASCARRYSEQAALSCRRCPIGARHAGEIGVVAGLARRSGLPGPRTLAACVAKVCVRCSLPSPRLIYFGLCVSCANRQLEVARGRNAKGSRPVRAASRLRRAIIQIAGDVSAWPCARSDHGPLLDPDGDGRWWLSWLFTDEAEARALVARWLPDAVVVAIEVGPALVDEAAWPASASQPCRRRASDVVVTLT